MARIFLTGSTGSLGSTLASCLLKRGHELVCLVRGENVQAARRRLLILDALNSVEVVCGDIRHEDCGISELERNNIGKIDFFLHCAASIDFLDAENATQTNVRGLQHVLNLASGLGAAQFHHVSTAYIAGDAVAFSEDNYNIGQSFRNPYENSKFQGEALVRNWAQANNATAAIYRPSILVGGSDGSIRSFDAFYTYLKPLALTAASMRRRNGQLPDGIRITTNNVVHLPLVVHMKRSSTLNVVPVDWAAARIADLVCARASGTFHIVHPQPPTVGWLFDTSMRALGIDGVQITGSAQHKQKLANRLAPLLARLQRSVDRVLGAYLPYTLQEPRFSDQRLRNFLKQGYIAPATIDEAYVQSILSYAESCNWEAEPVHAAALCAI